MKVSISIILLIFFFLASSFFDIPFAPPKKIKLILPKGWPSPQPIFADNPLTEEGFLLGRKLFYDEHLSKDSTISCASCHQQFAAFATFDHDFSHGFNNSLTLRNAPALINVAWMKELHWDGAISHLQVQPLAPITASNEMAISLDTLLYRLRRDSMYQRMFKEAFGSKGITTERMLKAFTQFVGSIQSYQSRYDQMKAGKIKFNANESSGYNIFKSNCSHCHVEPLFTDNTFRNNGLPINAHLNDSGRIAVTGLQEDALKFKVPTLRNITVTAPYMHDGRFFSLSQVLEHYTTNMQVESFGLDLILRKKIILSQQEKFDLLTFLHTLRDDSMLNNKRYTPSQFSFSKQHVH